jgi:hypothetical protein
MDGAHHFSHGIERHFSDSGVASKRAVCSIPCSFASSSKAISVGSPVA